MDAIAFLPIRYIAKIFKERDVATIVVIAGFFAVAATVMLVTFGGLRIGLQYLAGQEYFGEALTLTTLESFFGVVFVIALAASALRAVGVFLASRDTSFLLSLPLGAKKIFFARYPAYTLLSSWPALILGIPGVLALGATREHFFLTLVLGFAALALFLVLFTAVGAAIPLLLWPLARIIHPRLFSAGLAILILTGGLSLGRLILPDNPEQFYGTADLTRTQAPLDPIRQRFRFLPSHAVTETMFFASRGATSQAVTALGMLLAETATAALLLWVLVKWTFVNVLLFSQEQGGARKTAKGLAAKTLLISLPGKSNIAVMTKDALVILRNPRELLALLFFLSLFAFYTLLSWRIGTLGDITQSKFFPMLVGFNAAGVVYLASAFALRFIFPLIWREGQSAWILHSMPIPFRSLFRTKYVSAIGILWLVGTPLAFLTFWFLGLRAPNIVFATLEALAIFLLLATLNVGIGSLSPELRRRDPERMSTTPAGLLVTALALVTAAAFYFTARYIPEGVVANNFLLLVVVWVVALCVTFFFDRIVPKILVRRDLTI